MQTDASKNFGVCVVFKCISYQNGEIKIKTIFNSSILSIYNNKPVSHLNLIPVLSIYPLYLKLDDYFRHKNSNDRYKLIQYFDFL